MSDGFTSLINEKNIKRVYDVCDIQNILGIGRTKAYKFLEEIYHIKYWKKLLKDNNLPDIRFHDLRATYCTLLIKNNFNLKAISKVMGHSSEIISVDVYGDNEEIIADCLDELEPFIKLVKPKKDRDGFEDELLEGIDESIIEELGVI